MACISKLTDRSTRGSKSAWLLPGTLVEMPRVVVGSMRIAKMIMILIFFMNYPSILICNMMLTFKKVSLGILS
jgi:hypothetical protein